MAHEVKDITESFPEHRSIFKCQDDELPVLPQMRTHGMHGTAIIWADEINSLIEPIEGGSHRIIGIKILVPKIPSY